MIWEIALACVTMILTDVLGVLLVQAEARNHGWLAGWFDTAQWIPGIVCSAITITILQGHSTLAKALIIVFVSMANLFGTKYGQSLGTKYIKDVHLMSTKQQVDVLLERMDAVERVTKITPPTGN
jgi:hypothetical protein